MKIRYLDIINQEKRMVHYLQKKYTLLRCYRKINMSDIWLLTTPKRLILWNNVILFANLVKIDLPSFVIKCVCLSLSVRRQQCKINGVVC